jgi:hypothetical protein
LVGRYNNSVPARFLAPIDCSKISAQLRRQFNTSTHRPISYKDIIQCVTGEEGMGLCREHMQEQYTVYFTRFRTYKIAFPPQTKPRREWGLRHLPPSPFTGQFLRKAGI